MVLMCTIVPVIYIEDKANLYTSALEHNTREPQGRQVQLSGWQLQYHYKDAVIYHRYTTTHVNIHITASRQLRNLPVAACSCVLAATPDGTARLQLLLPAAF
jgi:hypothetical protein